MWKDFVSDLTADAFSASSEKDDSGYEAESSVFERYDDYEGDCTSSIIVFYYFVIFSQ